MSFLKKKVPKIPTHAELHDFPAPPIRAKVVNATSDFEKIGKGTVNVKGVLLGSIKTFPKFFSTFWKHFLIFSLITAILSGGIYFGLTHLESHFKGQQDSMPWRASVFSIFVLEMTLYFYLFTPIMLTAIQIGSGFSPSQQRKIIQPLFFINCFFLSIILAFLAWLLSLVHISLTLPVFLLAAFAFPAMAKFKQNPLQAFINSVLVFIRNPLSMAVLIIVCLIGSFLIGKIIWSFATWLNFRLVLLWIACLPLLPWLPFLALIHAKSFSQSFLTKASPLKRIF